jgi:hypothetical protein
VRSNLITTLSNVGGNNLVGVDGDSLVRVDSNQKEARVGLGWKNRIREIFGDE